MIIINISPFFVQCNGTIVPEIGELFQAHLYHGKFCGTYAALARRVGKEFSFYLQ